MKNTSIKTVVRIIPFNQKCEDLIRWLGNKLNKSDVFTAIIELPSDMPGGAYEKKRDQYLGDVVLAYLRQMHNRLGDTILGVTDLDCYTDSLSFVFGQASLKGFEAFVSTHRLRQSFYGLPEDCELLKDRLFKESIHELGHTLGLAHCPDRYCAMHFSHIIKDTDLKRALYCDKCNSMLEQYRSKSFKV